MSKNKTPISIAVTLIISIIGFVYFFTKPQNSTRNIEKYVSEYIENSIEVEIDVPDEIYFDLGTKYSGVKKIGNRAKLKGVTSCEFLFYNLQYNKHIRIVFVGGKKQVGSQLFGFDRILRGKHIVARINQSEWENFEYGKTDNPVPIFIFSIPKYAGWQDYEDIAITEEQYRNSVHFYLSNMPEDEFKLRFSAQTNN